MNILIIWEERPSPYSGAVLPAFNVLKHLSRSHTIRLLYLDDDLAASRSYPELERYCSRIDPVPWHPQSHSSQLLSVARDSFAPRKLFSDYRYFLTTKYSPEMASLVQDARHDKYDVVYASRPVAFYAWRFSTPKVMHAFDCTSAAYYQDYLRARRPMDKLYWLCTYLSIRSEEKRLLAAFDTSIVVSDEEYRAMKMLCPEARCTVVPNGVDVDFFAPLEIREEWPSLVFVGYMSSPPNVDAMLYFHSQVYDTLKRRFPDLKLFVVGQDPPHAIRELAKDPSIIVTGFVDDVRPYVARASVVIAPFISGPGIKNKVLEAMAMGKPVVTTSIGVRGINATHGDHLCIADNPVKFADHVEGLLLDKAKRGRIGHQAREFVKKHRSWARVTGKMDAIFHEVQNG
jgi:glycosyltransferase involved in cell wall biosynthesis